MHAFQPLEARRLFAGGVDPSFGPTSAAPFDAPGDVPTLLGRAIDPRGGVVLVGTTRDEGSDADARMFITRLAADGELELGFGGFGNGTSVGTPRGLTSLSDVVALRDGSGHVAIGRTGQPDGPQGVRLVKFGNNGRIDSTFGRDGVVAIDRMRPTSLLEQRDGKLLFIGLGEPRRFDSGGEPSYFAIRYTAGGRPDLSYGGTGIRAGEARLEEGDRPDQLSDSRTALSSATIDGGGRLLVSFSRRTATSSDGDDFTSSTRSNFARRFRGDGRPDPTFVGADIFFDATSDDEVGLPAQGVVTIARGDGQVVALRRAAGDRDGPLTLSLNGARGQFGATRARAVELRSLVPGFVVPTLDDGSLVAVDDDRIVVAGAIVNGSTRAPALARLTADLTLDADFGTAGVMTLPTAGASVEATDVEFAADGTLTATLRPARSAESTNGDVRVARVFQDDRPVVSLRSVQRKGAQLRVTVSIRGVNATDDATIDARDLRLAATDGARTGLRPSDVFDAGDGERRVLYIANRPRGTYALVSISNALADVSGGRNRGRTIGTFSA